MDCVNPGNPMFPSGVRLRDFGAWLDRNESTLSVCILRNGRDGHAPLVALFLSQDGAGDFLLRLCEGSDEKNMRWQAITRVEAPQGQAQAAAIFDVWRSMREAQGYRTIWRVSRDAAPSAAAARALSAYNGVTA